MTTRLLALAFCVLTASAGAVAVPLQSLFAQGKEIPKATNDPNKGGGIEADGDVGRYWMPLAGGGKLQVSFFAYWPLKGLANKTDHVLLSAQSASERLTTAEVAKLGELSSRVAQTCFNSKSERGAAIGAWLTHLNSGNATQKTAQFGPLNVTYSRQDETFVEFKRSGTPGQAPWVNYCSV